MRLPRESASGLFLLVVASLMARPPEPSVPHLSAAELARVPAVDSRLAERARLEIKVPAEFEVSVYATPPVVTHPTALAAAVDGTLFVGIDGNGTRSSFSGLGRVLRLRDRDGDGRVDEVKVFADNIDSPRGLVWDHDRLIVMHAPFISAFTDHDGDGVAEEQKVLITGVGKPLEEARVNHGQNGLTAGIDGWIYLALGDQGMQRAEGADGRTLQSRHGGIVRFRPDGTGLELWGTGTRNVYQVAVSPLLDVIGRDNSNDGRGWDVKIEHFSGLTEHGYPSLFKNFPGEFSLPLTEQVGGAGTGGVWVDEPGIPARWNHAPFTGDFSRKGFFHEKLEQAGASFKVTSEVFVECSSAMNLEIDGRSTFYLSTWRGGSSAWNGPDTGMLYRLQPKGYVAPALPDYARLSLDELLAELDSPSFRRRFEAQRVLLRQADGKAELIPRLSALAADGDRKLETRVLALFTLKQLAGAGAASHLQPLLADASIAAWALRALTDNLHELQGVSWPLVVQALPSPNPRIRNEAILALARGQRQEAAAAIVPHLVDADPVVALTAAEALKALGAVEVCFAVLDTTDGDPRLRIGVARVLQALHRPEVVDGLIGRLERETDPARRFLLVSALARLAHVEKSWNGDWWGPHVDNTGPYVEPVKWSESDRIEKVLEQTLNAAAAREVVAYGRELRRQGVAAKNVVNKYLDCAAAAPDLIPEIVQYLADAKEVPAKAVPLLAAAAENTEFSTDSRLRAVAALLKTTVSPAWKVIAPTLESVERLQGDDENLPPGLLEIQRVMLEDAARSLQPSVNKMVTARHALLETIYSGRLPADIPKALAPLLDAERELVALWGETMAAIQASRAPLTQEQLTFLAEVAGRQIWGPREDRRMARISGVGPAQLQAMTALENSLRPTSREVVVQRQRLFQEAAKLPGAGGSWGELLRCEADAARQRAEGFATVQVSPAKFEPRQITDFVRETVKPTAGLFRRRDVNAQKKLTDQLRRTTATFYRSPQLGEALSLLTVQAAVVGQPGAQVAEGALIELANRRWGASADRETAAAALREGWNDPVRRIQILLATADLRASDRPEAILPLLQDADIATRLSARRAADALGLLPDPALARDETPRVASLPVDEVILRVSTLHGSRKHGEQLVDRLRCTSCHTVRSSEPPKGPVMEMMTFARRDLADAILRPSKTIAHGYATNLLALSDGSSVLGFIVEEKDETLLLRDLLGAEHKIPASRITQRDVLEYSLMPEGLLGESTLLDLASLLDYLESLRPN